MKRYIYRHEPFGSLAYDSFNGEILLNCALSNFDREDTRIINFSKTINAPISYPITTFLELTKKCNSMCNHCFNNSGLARNEELTASQWYAIIDDLYRNGVFNVKITGGEPFCRGDLFEILNFLNSKGIDFTIFTNGKLVDDECIVKLKKYSSLTCVRVSIDGNKTTNDSIRGVGSFDEAFAAIRKLSHADIPCEVNYTISKANYTQILDVAHLILEEELKCNINIGMLKVSGRASEHEEEYFFIADELNDALLAIKEQLRASSVIKPYHLLQPVYFGIFKNQFGCPAGKLSAMINSIGDVYACGLFSENDSFICGNMTHNDLPYIWGGTEMNYIRSLPERDECKKCNIYKKKCTGACRGNALNYYGDICESDINCKVYTMDFNE